MKGFNSSIGLKLYVKRQLFKTPSKFALSFMGSFGCVSEFSTLISESSCWKSEVTSYLLRFELNLPMSYRINNDMSWIFNPKIFYFSYNSPLKIETIKCGPYSQDEIIRDEVYNVN